VEERRVEWEERRGRRGGGWSERKGEDGKGSH
jgi:hypothetical protein